MSSVASLIFKTDERIDQVIRLCRMLDPAQLGYSVFKARYHQELYDLREIMILARKQLRESK